MPMFKFFLDTSALIRLSRLEGKKLEEFRARFGSKNAELVITHVAVDEATHGLKFGEKAGKGDRRVSEYREKIDKALRALETKGIPVRVESTNIFVIGISRFGFGSFATKDIEEVYEKLWRKIEDCEKAKGRSKDPLNIKRDAVIGISPLEYSFLVTTDQCFCDSFNEVAEKNKNLIKRVMTPKAKRADRSPEGVADRILEVFGK